MLNQSFIIYIQIIYIIKIGVPSPTVGNLCGVNYVIDRFCGSGEIRTP